MTGFRFEDEWKRAKEDMRRAEKRVAIMFCITALFAVTIGIGMLVLLLLAIRWLVLHG